MRKLLWSLVSHGSDTYLNLTNLYVTVESLLIWCSECQIPIKYHHSMQCLQEQLRIQRITRRLPHFSNRPWKLFYAIFKGVTVALQWVPNHFFSIVIGTAFANLCCCCRERAASNSNQFKHDKVSFAFMQWLSVVVEPDVIAAGEDEWWRPWG